MLWRWSQLYFIPLQWAGETWHQGKHALSQSQADCMSLSVPQASSVSFSPYGVPVAHVSASVID